MDNEPLGIDGIRAFTARLRRVNWSSGFSLKGIRSYDGERDQEAWLQVYTMAVKAAGGSQSAMANYLPVILSPTVQDWLTGLPENSIDSWGDLCAIFINNFQETFTKPGVECDLYQVHQKKGESLREFIRRFIRKKNSIPSVSDAVVMATFRKGVKNPDLLKKMSRKPRRTVKELFSMANWYANQEDAMVE